MKTPAVTAALLRTMYAGPFPASIRNQKAPLYQPSAEQVKAVSDAVERMEAAGVEWTPDVVGLIAAGDQDYAAAAYGEVDGYPELTALLGAIFQEYAAARGR